MHSPRRDGVYKVDVSFISPQTLLRYINACMHADSLCRICNTLSHSGPTAASCPRSSTGCQRFNDRPCLKHIPFRLIPTSCLSPSSYSRLHETNIKRTLIPFTQTHALLDPLSICLSHCTIIALSLYNTFLVFVQALSASLTHSHIISLHTD